MNRKSILLVIAALLFVSLSVTTYYLYVDKDDTVIEDEFVPGGGDFRGDKGATGSWDDDTQE